MDNEDKRTGGSGGPDAGDEGLKGSARQIWLAGLGALARAQQEGGKLFETLAREGASLQGKLPEVQERMGRAREQVAGVAAKASDRIEGMFDDQVARALDRLDVPRGADFDALTARIDALERSVAALATAPTARGPDDARPSAPAAPGSGNG